MEHNLQVQTLSASNSGEMKGTFESLVIITKKQGWKQLFSGLSINYLKVTETFINLFYFIFC